MDVRIDSSRFTKAVIAKIISEVKRTSGKLSEEMKDYIVTYLKEVVAKERKEKLIELGNKYVYSKRTSQKANWYPDPENPGEMFANYTGGPYDRQRRGTLADERYIVEDVGLRHQNIFYIKVYSNAPRNTPVPGQPEGDDDEPNSFIQYLESPANKYGHQQIYSEYMAFIDESWPVHEAIIKRYLYKKMVEWFNSILVSVMGR